MSNDIPDGAVRLATLTLVRMPSGAVRFALIEASDVLKRDARATPFPTLYAYVRHIIRDAALRLAEPPSQASAIVPPCCGGQRREQDEWVCACGCERRWPVGEKRP